MLRGINDPCVWIFHYIIGEKSGLAASGHRLVIDIPTGRKATGQEIQALQEGLTAAVGLLLRFYDGRADRQETASALLEAIEALAWHHGNVQRNDEPELDFNGRNS